MQRLALREVGENMILPRRPVSAVSRQRRSHAAFRRPAVKSAKSRYASSAGTSREAFR